MVGYGCMWDVCGKAELYWQTWASGCHSNATVHCHPQRHAQHLQYVCIHRNTHIRPETPRVIGQHYLPAPFNDFTRARRGAGCLSQRPRDVATCWSPERPRPSITFHATACSAARVSWVRLRSLVVQWLAPLTCVPLSSFVGTDHCANS